MLFTCKQHCLHKKFLGGPTCDEYLSSCKISSSVVLWFWQYSSSTRLKAEEEKEDDKAHEKTSFAVFPGCYVEIHLFLVNLLFFVCLDIDVTRNGNNLKLKVKFEFFLSMGLMLINHSNPYTHSTTVLCNYIKQKRC